MLLHRSEFQRFLNAIHQHTCAEFEFIEQSFPRSLCGATDDYGYAFLHYIAGDESLVESGDTSQTYRYSELSLAPFDYVISLVKSLVPTLATDVLMTRLVSLSGPIRANPYMALLLRADYTMQASASSTVASHTSLHVAAANNHYTMLYAMLEYILTHPRDFVVKYGDVALVEQLYGETTFPMDIHTTRTPRHIYTNTNTNTNTNDSAVVCEASNASLEAHIDMSGDTTGFDGAAKEHDGYPSHTSPLSTLPTPVPGQPSSSRSPPLSPPTCLARLPPSAATLLTKWLCMRDGCGYTPLDYAAEEGAVEAAALLLAFGATPDDVNEHGRTALMLAAEEGHCTIITLLCSFARHRISTDTTRGDTTRGDTTHAQIYHAVF